MIAPRISIVTPSFNQGQFLEECIDSVLSQNYPNLEYIVMDGGSTDNSVEIIKKYEKYLIYWQSKPDGGQYRAINEGFKKTSGEILAWLNSDDMYHQSSFYKTAHVFSKYKEIDWITGRPTVFDRDGNIVLVFDYLPVFSREKYLNAGYSNPHIQQESTFWRRSLWKKLEVWSALTWSLRGMWSCGLDISVMLNYIQLMRHSAATDIMAIRKPYFIWINIQKKQI